MKTHIKIVIGQAIFLVLVLGAVFLFYPFTNVDVKGNSVDFNSINAKVIMISQNPDFSNPRYIEINKNYSVELNPGTYYWKASNNLIEGAGSKFSIQSEVGLGVNESGNNVENIGNVKLNVTKTKDGQYVGRVILDVKQAEKLENATYTGRQDG